MRQAFLLILLFCPLVLPAQRDLSEARFIINGRSLSIPYAGGVNSVIASGVDLNRDGKEDLVLFDKSDNHYMSFRNEGVAGEIRFIPDESLSEHFPDAVDYAYFTDMNHDGAADLFVMSESGGAGMAYYIGYWKGNRLAFRKMSDRLQDSSGRSLYIDRTNLPAIADLNGDGDLDIVLVDFGYSTITYYENLETERNLPADTLILKPKTNCWGYVCECSQSDNSITLNYHHSVCFYNMISGFPGKGNSNAHRTRHTGATLLVFDPDGDGDPDMLEGDAGFSNLIYLENGRNDAMSLFDSIIRLDTAFPGYDVPVDYNIFPAPYYLDLNNDGKKDLLVSTYTPPACYINSILDTQYNRDLMWYANEGRNGRDTFRLQAGSFLTDDMIDLGFGVHAKWFDYNKDGLTDIVAGRCYQRSAAEPDSVWRGMVLLENTGDSSHPRFELVDRDYAGLSQSVGLGMIPDFYDADGDGDEDMIIAERSGALYFYRDTSAPGVPASFQRIPHYFDGISALTEPAPFMSDVDGDGRPDLLLGERQGRIFYYRNYGTGMLPDFRLESNFWGEVDARQGYFYGNSVPWLGDADGDGQRELLVGNYLGNVLKYTGMDQNPDGKFDLVDSNYMNIRWGGRIGADVADVNADGKADFLLGNYRGGLRIRSFANPIGIEKKEKENWPVELFPNPASEYTILRSGLNKKIQFHLVDLSGRVLEMGVLQARNQVILNLSGYPPAVYLLLLNDGQNEEQKKLIIIR